MAYGAMDPSMYGGYGGDPSFMAYSMDPYSLDPSAVMY